MSKKCLKCGCIISEDSITDYCFNCSNSNNNNVKGETESITKEDDGYTLEELVLVIMAYIFIFSGIIAAFVLSQFGFMENILMILLSPISGIISCSIFICIAKASKNIRDIRNK